MVAIDRAAPVRVGMGLRAIFAVLFLVGSGMVLSMCQPAVPATEQSISEIVGDAAVAVDVARDGKESEGGVPDAPPLRAVCARDIQGDFAKLPAQGQVIVFREGDVFQGDDEFQYAFHTKNQLGSQNHFQGVVRWGRHLYVSGGDLKRLEAHVLVVGLGSRVLTGPWESNTKDLERPPPAEDTVLEKRKVTQENRWHAGGLGSYGSILAVPVENNQGSAGKRGSSLLFFDLSTPEKPISIPISISSDEVAYAVGLTRLALGGKYLLARWNDKELTFFTSKSNDIKSGFETTSPVVWDVGQLKVSVKEVGDAGMHGQSVALLTQCDGKLFALMNDNPNRLPTTQGVHYLDLYRIQFPGDDTSKLPAIEKIGSRGFLCPDQQCHFTAGGGAHIAQDGRLFFYSVPLFRDFARKIITVVEFVPTP